MSSMELPIASSTIMLGRVVQLLRMAKTAMLSRAAVVSVGVGGQDAVESSKVSGAC